MKKMLMLTVALAMGLAQGAIQEVGGIVWSYSPYDGGVEITSGSYRTAAISTTTAGAIAVPSTLGGQTVVRIGDSAFYNCSSIMSVFVPATVTSMGSYVFYYCSQLTSVTFAGNCPCSSRWAGDIYYSTPESLVTYVPYGSGGWYNGSSYIHCGRLPDNWQSRAIQHYGTPRMRTVTLHAQGGTLQQTQLVYLDGTSVELPRPTPGWAMNFDGWYDEPRGGILLSDGGTEYPAGDLELYAHWRNAGPNSGEPDDENLHYAYDRTTGYSWSFLVTEEGTAELYGVTPEPEGVLTLPSSVKDNDSMETYAVVSVGHAMRKNDCSSCCSSESPMSGFQNLTEVTRVIIPSSVKTIGSCAFRGCTALTSVSLPDSVMRLESYAFSNTGFTSFTIPATVTSFSLGAFHYCEKLQTLTVAAKSVSVDDVDLDIWECPHLENLNLPEQVMGDWSDEDYGYSMDVSGLQSLKTLTIPEGVTSLYRDSGHEYALSSLTAAYLPSTLRSIDDDIFDECWNLDKVVFGGKMLEGDWDEGNSIECLWTVLAYANSIYYPEAYAANWRKILRNLGYGGTHGVYAPAKVSLMKAMVMAAPKYADAGTPDFGPYVVGVEGTQTAATCAGYEMTGDIPAGLSWNSASGTLSGTATESGVFTVNVNGTAMTVRVDPAPEVKLDDEEETGGTETIPYRAVESVTAAYVAVKARTLNGCILQDGAVVGSVQVKLGKVSKGKSKVSGSFVLFDGTKGTILSTSVTVTDGAPASFSCTVKKFGALTMTVGGDDFAGDLGGYHLQSGEIGFAGKTQLSFSLLDAPMTIKSADVKEECLPRNESMTVQGGKKLVFGPAASVKYKKVKDKVTKVVTYNFIVDTDEGKKPNKSGLKLTYDVKKGTFKGSFKIYAVDETKHKLIKTTTNVTGIMIDGRGYGTVMAKGVGTWLVTIE